MEEKNTNEFLFPLSYDAELEETDDLKIYYQYIDEAFAESRICNMAVSGSHGIGKSSILHSYDKKRQKKWEEEQNNSKKWIPRKKKNQDKPRFLYVSLGKYIDDTVVEKDEADSRSVEKDTKTAQNIDSIEKNIIERRILLQIYARFHKKDIAKSRFPMIQESSDSVGAKSIVGGIIILAILLLMFYKPLGKLIKAVIGDDCLLFAVKTKIHIALYIIVFAAIVILGILLIHYMLTQMHLKNVAVKTNNTEIDIEKSACEDYLDVYATELIYCLEQLADKIDNTVVFEDMDRLNQKECIEIFTRLREINFMINQRLAGEQHIRFIYVIKDEVLSTMQHAKFFDYILPIIPEMNGKSSEDIFRENLKKVNERLKKRFPDDKKIEAAMQFVAERQEGTRLTHITASYIKDYRMQYAILNDYSLFFELYYINNRKEIRINTAEGILALAVYKNVWPKQYDKVTSGMTSELFDSYTLSNDNFAKLLTGSRFNFLSYENFCYLGYSKEKLLNNIKKYIETAKTIREKRGIIRKFPRGEIYVEALHDFIKKEVPYQENSQDMKEEILMLAEIFHIYIKNNTQNMGDLLRNRDIHLCLAALGYLHESDWKKYIDIVKEQKYFLLDERNGDTFNVFDKCLNWNNIADRNDWKEREIEVLIYGMNNEYEYEQTYLQAYDKYGNPEMVNLEESIRQRKICIVVPE